MTDLPGVPARQPDPSLSNLVYTGPYSSASVPGPLNGSAARNSSLNANSAPSTSTRWLLRLFGVGRKN